MVAFRIWALVSDCVRARILRGLERGGGDADPPTELVERPQARGIRAALSGAAPGTAAGPEEDVAQFARTLLRFLDTHRVAGDFTRLAVFAEPRMLSALRAAAPPALWSTVILEEPRNLVILPETTLRATVLQSFESHRISGERP
ncbi:host attachment protein [Rhodosalinus sp. 5P4]|uniref:host attachment protein n=1 Tax=Rhodosalinus sp. 5P4 TaxID=3239196 RepID=UPI00352649AC